MENRELVRAIILLSRLHRLHIEKTATAMGLYFGQPNMLNFISDNPGCSQSELANLLHITEASAATSLKRLEKAGFLERKTDDSDTRKKKLSLTSVGESKLRDFNNLCDETDTMLFEGFTEKEKNLYFSFTERLIKNINDDNLTIEDCRKIFIEQKKDENKKLNEINGGH